MNAVFFRIHQSAAHRGKADRFFFYLFLFFFFAVLLFSPEGRASEKQRLLQLAEELNFFLQSVASVENTASATGDMLFDYVALRADIRLIRRAILNHVAEPSRMPRRLPPLRGDYSVGVGTHNE